MYRDARIIAETETGRRLKTSEVSGFWVGKAANFIRQEPGRYLKLLFKKIVYTFSPEESIVDAEYWAIKGKVSVFKFVFTDLRYIMPFVLLGLLLGLKRFKNLLPLYAVAATLSLSVGIFFVSTRYRVAMVPFFMIFAAFAISSMWDFLKARKYIMFIPACLFLSISAWLLGRPREILRAPPPNKQWALFESGVAYHRLNDFKKAEDYFNRAYQIGSKLPPVLYSLIDLYARKGDVQKVKEIGQIILKYWPDDKNISDMVKSIP